MNHLVEIRTVPDGRVYRATLAELPRLYRYGPTEADAVQAIVEALQQKLRFDPAFKKNPGFIKPEPIKDSEKRHTLFVEVPVTELQILTDKKLMSALRAMANRRPKAARRARHKVAARLAAFGCRKEANGCARLTWSQLEDYTRVGEDLLAEHALTGESDSERWFLEKQVLSNRLREAFATHERHSLSLMREWWKRLQTRMHADELAKTQPEVDDVDRAKALDAAERVVREILGEYADVPRDQLAGYIADKLERQDVTNAAENAHIRSRHKLRREGVELAAEMLRQVENVDVVVQTREKAS